MNEPLVWQDFLEKAEYLKEHGMFQDVDTIELAKRIFEKETSKEEEV